MYYAPWDADSQLGRDVIDRVADVVGDNQDIFFAAVNCWTANGECFQVGLIKKVLKTQCFF